MRSYRRTSTLQQMTVSLCVFAGLMLLLESGGLYDWAQRLELGPERTVALPIATWLHRELEPLGIERERSQALVAMARVGWSDDPALLASVESQPVPRSIEKPLSGTSITDAAPGANAKTQPANDAHPPPPVTTVLTTTAVALEAPPLTSALPATPLDTTMTPITAAVEPLTIALTGDSMMAVGLSAAIFNDAPKYKGLQFLKTFKSGTGLARPEVFNWELEYPAMIKDAHPNFVIVAIGANDGQGFQVGKTVYPFGSEGWQLIYEQRVDAFLRTLTKDGATVVWLGLPPMKDATLASKMDQVNRIQYSVVNASPHAIWFSTAGIVGDSKGVFRDFGEVRGKTDRLRAGDGIHMSDQGAELIAEKLLPWLAAQSGTKSGLSEAK